MPFRILPQLTPGNREFWSGGAAGELRFLRCQECQTYVHPPAPRCPVDHSPRVEWTRVSGRATVASFTVNHQPWMPGPELPYVVAIVEIVEQTSVRLTTNVVNCEPESVHVGMPVRVVFEHHPDEDGDVWIPLFEPDPDART